MKLYALCDQEMLDKKSISLETFVNIAKKNSAVMIQYRNKSADTLYIKKQLIAIRNIYDGFLIVNDKYELIEYCDGVHMGQEDLLKIDKSIAKAVEIIRAIIKEDKIFGISTHNAKEITEANQLNLNYIGLGAYRKTSTKSNVSVILGDTIDQLASQSKHLVAAIGGVTLEDKFQNITYSVIGSGLVSA